VRQETSGFMPPELWRTLTLSISLQDLGLLAGSRVQEAKHVLAQRKQRLMQVWADFEQTLVDKQ